MFNGSMRELLRQLRRWTRGPGGAELSDGALLERFVTSQDELAFEDLLRRHAALVLGVCARVLHDPQDVEDAFQATFLVLLRRAGALDREAPLGPWLYTVAYHTALRARAQAARRRREERQAMPPLPAMPDESFLWRDLRPVLDEELNRLGEKYRAPVVLCYLEGKTHEQAARQLGWPRGTVAGRLARAKEVLRRRLLRRGVTLSAGALAGLAVGVPVVPRGLLESTLRAAQVFLLAGETGAACSASVLALTQSVLRGLVVGRAKALLAGVLALGLAAGGASLASWHLAGRSAGPPHPERAAAGSCSGAAQERPPLPREEARLVPASASDEKSEGPGAEEKIDANADECTVVVVVLYTCQTPTPQTPSLRVDVVSRSRGRRIQGRWGAVLAGEKAMAKPLISDALWHEIQPLLPAPRPRRTRYPGRRPLDPRRVLTGIVFVLKSGIPWEALPAEMGCGSGMSCLNYLRSWQQAGVWQKMAALLRARLPDADRFDWARASEVAMARGQNEDDGRPGEGPWDGRGVNGFLPGGGSWSAQAMP
jgi:RNA polymerase sigma factor (sigma-70 family)